MVRRGAAALRNRPARRQQIGERRRAAERAQRMVRRSDDRAAVFPAALPNRGELVGLGAAMGVVFVALLVVRRHIPRLPRTHALPRDGEELARTSP